MNSRTLATMAVSACAAFCFGQITVTHFRRQDDSVFATPTANYDNSGVTGTSATGTFKLDGYQSYILDRLETHEVISASLYVSFNVGPLPVLMSNISLTSNGKLVVTGSFDSDDSSYSLYNGQFKQYLDANANDRYDFGETTYSYSNLFGANNAPVLVGDRVTVYDVGPFPTADVLFGPGLKYVCVMSTAAIIDYAVGSNRPDMTLTQEFHTPTFNGVRLNFDHAVVPEPATFAALGLGAACLLRRSRRRA